MRNRRRTTTLAIILLTMLLTGCLAPSIKLTIDPIEVNQGNKELEATMHFRLSGFSSRYEIGKIEGVILDATGKKLHEFSEDLAIHFPVAPLITQKREVKIPLTGASFYADLQDPNQFGKLKGQYYELQVVLTGTTRTEGKGQIFFK